MQVPLKTRASCLVKLSGLDNDLGPAICVDLLTNERISCIALLPTSSLASLL